MENVEFKSKIAEAIERIEKQLSGGILVFQPDARFYKQVGITPKRWGQLIRGDTEPYHKEIKALANYFNLSINDF